VPNVSGLSFEEILSKASEKTLNKIVDLLFATIGITFGFVVCCCYKLYSFFSKEMGWHEDYKDK